MHNHGAMVVCVWGGGTVTEQSTGTLFSNFRCLQFLVHEDYFILCINLNNILAHGVRVHLQCRMHLVQPVYPTASVMIISHLIPFFKALTTVVVLGI